MREWAVGVQPPSLCALEHEELFARGGVLLELRRVDRVGIGGREWNQEVQGDHAYLVENADQFLCEEHNDAVLTVTRSREGALVVTHVLWWLW